MTLQYIKDPFATKFSLSDEIIQLYDAANVRNANEAIAVLFHAFLLESGFIPKDASQSDIYKLMPENWNANGVFKMRYSHYCCPSFTCYVTCVPLYNNVSVHGIICDTVSSESVNFKMNLSKYIKQKKDLCNVSEVFRDVDELSRNFKDNFCLPLLNLLHETIGVKHLFGFSGIYDDLKILILMLLPVESVVRMSSVNKNLHTLANLPFLWKYLYQRDYGKDGVANIETSSKTDWKEMYKNEYVKKNRKPESRHYRLPHFRLPWIFDPDHRLPRILDPRFPYLYGSDFDSDFGIDYIRDGYFENLHFEEVAKVKEDDETF